MLDPFWLGVLWEKLGEVTVLSVLIWAMINVLDRTVSTLLQYSPMEHQIDMMKHQLIVSRP